LNKAARRKECFDAAHIAVAETQFMMGKFNRPGLFYKGGPLGPIFTQFMSFPFQYVEMMAKNLMH